MGINRIKLQNGSPLEMAKAEAAAAQDPALNRIRQQLFGEGYVQDIGKGEGIAQYYSGFGLPQSLQFTLPVEEVAPVADVTQPVVDTGGGGGGGGVTGITSASAVQPTSDPFLASGAAGGARLPKITDQAGAIAAMTQDPAYSLPGQSDPFLASGAAGGARLPATQATTTLPSGDVFATDDPMLQEKMDYTEQQDPTFWENARDKFVQTGQDVGNIFTDLKDKGIDVGKMAGSAIMNMIAPGLGFIAQNVGTASGMQQEAVKDQFVDEGVVLDDTGRIVQQPGLAYDTPENVMAGYTPGATGLQIGDVSVGGNIIQESIVDRLSDLEKTKNEKYGGSFYNADGTPKNNPDTGQPTTLGAREEALKENLNMVARAAGAVTLEDYDSISKKAGETTYATDYFPELGQEATAPTTIDELAGVDEGLKSRLLRGGKGPGEISGVAGTTIVDPDTYLGSKVDVGRSAMGTIDRTQPTEPVTGVEGPPSILNPEIYQDPIMEMAAKQAAAEAQAAVASAAAAQRAVDRNRGDGEGPKNIDTGNVTTAKGPPSQLSSSQNVYQDAIMRGQTGGGGGGGGGGSSKIVCTMMNESYGFGSFRNKIWMKFHKDLSPEYQKGYHKLFLPLVKIAKTNKVVKKVLEHIAVHSTIDMRQATRGKTHLLGRVYRKILLPICYIVGKNAKR